MLKTILLFGVVFFFFVVGNTQVEFANEKFPFTEVVEWPGKGTLFMGEDPTKKTLEINLSLLNDKGGVEWNRSVYPKEKGTSLIISGTSNYLYFVDNFQPIDNAIRYNQVNRSGSIVPTKIDMLSVIRSYNYRNPNELILRDIVNTSKALVFYYQLPVSGENIYENFFVTVTHHNNRIYHCKAPSSRMDLMKKNAEGHFIFAGADEETISFSRYGAGGENSKIDFFTITPKAEILTGNSYKIPNDDALLSNLYFLALDGSYYLETKNRQKIVANGRGLFLGGEFYYVVNDAKEGVLKVYKQNEKGKVEAVFQTEKIKPSSKKNIGELTFFSSQDKLIVLSEINKVSTGIEIKNHEITEISVSSIDKEQLVRNPSAAFTAKKTSEYIHFVDGTPYYLDKESLGNKIITLKEWK